VIKKDEMLTIEAAEGHRRPYVDANKKRESQDGIASGGVNSGMRLESCGESHDLKGSKEEEGEGTTIFQEFSYSRFSMKHA